MRPRDILEFWKDVGPRGWFRADPALDAAMRDRFAAFLGEAARLEPPHWRDTANGMLALVILFDQFSRNIHRGSAKAFENDERARALADEALRRGGDRACDPSLAHFFFMPFMHSENLADQDRCVALFAARNDAQSGKFARTHRDVIARFGRFPHRNAALGRKPTPDEIEFLANGGFSA